MRLLICDKIHPLAIEFLQHNKIAYEYRPEILLPALLNSIHNYEGILVRSRTKVTRDVIEKAVNLKFIGRVGSGVDNIHMESAKAKNITVVNAPDGNSQAVAEHTIGLMIALLRHYPKAFTSMKEGMWLKKELTGSELSGKTVGIVGFGHVGKRVEALVRAFGAKVLIFSKSSHTISLAELFKQSDIITVHCSLTPQTKGMITRELIATMKPSAYLINTSRGEIVDEGALFDALKNHSIAGAALDVFWEEPLPMDSHWRQLPRVILTPHIGAATHEALEKASMTIAQDIARFVKGEKVENIVS